MEFLQSLIMTPYGAIAALLLIMVVGEFIAKLTKGALPMAFGVTILLLAGFWTKILPANIVELSGITASFFGLISALLVANMGTLINRQEMIAQWKTVVICLMGLVGIITIALTVGGALFGFTNAAAATPALAGAAMAVAAIRQAAEAAGTPTAAHAALIAVVVMSVQGLFGYPLTSFCLKKEAQRLSAEFKAGTLRIAAAEQGGAKGADTKPESTNMALLKLAIVALLSYVLQVLTAKAGFQISMYVWALLLGFAGHETHLLQTDGLTKANAYGLAVTVLMLYLFGGLSSSDPNTILPVFGTAAALVLMGAAAMAVVAVIASKLFHKTFYMAFATTLNAYLGFPVNVMLVNEALDLNTDSPEERAAVSAEIMPPMLVGSFVCVTIVSVVIAGMLVKYIV